MESLEIDNYTVGQEDLIQYIKMSLANIAHTSEDEDIMFDFIHFLKNLKPIKKE